jgi:hypothetical protein
LNRASLTVFFVALAAAAAGAAEPEMPAGFLCCNMRSDGSKIIDINYEGPKMHIVPVGTPVKVTSMAWHNRVNVDINGKSLYIKNDYSRNLSLDVFAKRYVVADDPTVKIANFPEKIRDAIAAAKLVKGMTRAQVIMSVGYPVSTENPNLDARVWKFWLGSFDEFDVTFDDDSRVIAVDATGEVKAKVLME